jgi:hypothetical protein
VDVATLAVDRFLKNKVDAGWLKTGHGTAFLAKDAACLRVASCWKKDAAFAANIQSIVGSRGRIVETHHAHIIPWSMNNFQRHKGHHHHGKHHGLTSTGHAARVLDEAPMQMKAPNLKHDEFMVHVYVRFQRAGWHHLDVVMTEDAAGHPKVRYFFTTRMVSRGGSLPPGVVC